jgi:hypothetical protein
MVRQPEQILTYEWLLARAGAHRQRGVPRIARRQVETDRGREGISKGESGGASESSGFRYGWNVVEHVIGAGNLYAVEPNRRTR